MEGSFRTPPRNRDKLNPLPIKRGTINTRMVQMELEKSITKGIKISSVNQHSLRQKKHATSARKTHSIFNSRIFREILLLLVIFTEFYFEKRYIPIETYKSKGTMFIDSKIGSIFDSFHIQNSISAPFFATLVLFSFYKLCSAFCEDSYVPLLTTMALSLDFKFSGQLFGSFGFSFACFFSILALIYSKKVVFEMKPSVSIVYQTMAFVFATLATLCRYELSVLYLLIFISLIIKVTTGLKLNDLATSILSFVAMFVLSAAILFVVDYKTDIISISFDLPALKDSVSSIMENDKDGLLFVSLVCASLLLVTKRLETLDYCFTAAIVFLSIFAQRSPLSSFPDVVLRSVIIRIALIATASSLMAKANNIGLFAVFVVIIYKVLSYFVPMPHTLIQRLFL